MKAISEQFSLALFAGREAKVSEVLPKAVNIIPHYAVEKDKEGKTIKDAKGNAVFKKDTNGQPIVASMSLNVLPRKSDDNPDLADLSGGLTGQPLFGFDRQVRDEACDVMIAKLTKMRADGTHTFAGARMTRNGRFSLSVKPVMGGKSIAVTSDEELIQELERRGHKVEANPAKGNGVPATTPGELEIEVEPATKKGKGKGKNTPAAAVTA